MNKICPLTTVCIKSTQEHCRNSRIWNRNRLISSQRMIIWNSSGKRNSISQTFSRKVQSSKMGFPKWGRVGGRRGGGGMAVGVWSKIKPSTKGKWIFSETITQSKPDFYPHLHGGRLILVNCSAVGFVFGSQFKRRNGWSPLPLTKYCNSEASHTTDIFRPRLLICCCSNDP